MRVVFSTLFQKDLREAGARYADISPKLGEEFHERVREATLTIIRRGGGDHVGSHGFPCRKCRPFPYLICYQLEGENLFILGLVHERRHPDHLRNQLPPPS